MIINHLNSFIKPISSLTIMETLGEGKIVLNFIYTHLATSHLFVYSKLAIKLNVICFNIYIYISMYHT